MKLQTQQISSNPDTFMFFWKTNQHDPYGQQELASVVCSIPEALLHPEEDVRKKAEQICQLQKNKQS